MAAKRTYEQQAADALRRAMDAGGWERIGLIEEALFYHRLALKEAGLATPDGKPGGDVIIDFPDPPSEEAEGS